MNSQARCDDEELKMALAALVNGHRSARLHFSSRVTILERHLNSTIASRLAFVPLLLCRFWIPTVHCNLLKFSEADSISKYWIKSNPIVYLGLICHGFLLHDSPDFPRFRGKGWNAMMICWVLQNPEFVLHRLVGISESLFTSICQILWLNLTCPQFLAKIERTKRQIWISAKLMYLNFLSTP
jgi:hypothetical protein